MTSTFIYSGGASNSQDLPKAFFYFLFLLLLLWGGRFIDSAKVDKELLLHDKREFVDQSCPSVSFKGIEQRGFRGWNHNFHPNKYGKESRLKSLLIQELKENGEEADSGGDSLPLLRLHPYYHENFLLFKLWVGSFRPPPPNPLRSLSQFSLLLHSTAEYPNV